MKGEKKGRVDGELETYSEAPAVSRASNLTKLSVTANLGVIHWGHEKESLSLMESYLNVDTVGISTGYAEAALGLIHL